MAELNKTLKSYLIQLITIGIIYFCISSFFIWGILKSISEFPLTYLPLIIVGLFFGYIASIKYPAGGNVNYYLKKHTLTENEKILDSLIIKFRNKTLITFISFIISAFIIASGIKNSNPEAFFSLDLFVGALIIPAITMAMLGVGVKYISAWWNIQRNMKKENGTYKIEV